MENLNKMGKNQHDMAKEPDVFELRLDMFCDRSHLPLIVCLSDYPEPSDPHRHCDFSELAVVLEGTAVSCVPDREVTLETGDILLLGTGTLHHLTRIRGLRNYNVLFDRRLLDTLTGIGRFRWLQIGEREYSPPMHLSAGDLPGAVMLLEKMRDEQLARSPGWELALLGGFCQLLGYISRHARLDTDGHGASASGFQLGRVLRFMEENAVRPLSVEQLSRQAQMSESSFRHLFKDATGLAPVEYLIRLRCRRAMLDMFSSNHTISEIALESGFSDGNYFARKFREVTGRSPREFRRGCRSGEIEMSGELSRILQP